MDIRQYSKNIRSRSEKFATVVSACSSLLKYSKHAEECHTYLRNRMSNHSIERFSIGYFPGTKNLGELVDLVGLDTLLELDLIRNTKVNNRSHIDRFNRSYFDKHNIIFPFKDEYGNIIALAGRTLLDKEAQREFKVPKYKNTVFMKSMHLYGLYHTKDAIEQNGFAVIVEGQIDCINCHANGFFNTVALTSSELTPYQLYILKKMTNQIYLLLDNDESGNKATKKAINRYSKHINIKHLKLPEPYNDVDDYLRQSTQRNIFDICYKSGGA